MLLFQLYFRSLILLFKNFKKVLVQKSKKYYKKFKNITTLNLLLFSNYFRLIKNCKFLVNITEMKVYCRQKVYKV